MSNRFDSIVFTAEYKKTELKSSTVKKNEEKKCKRAIAFWLQFLCDFFKFMSASHISFESVCVLQSTVIKVNILLFIFLFLLVLQSQTSDIYYIRFFVSKFQT